MMKTNKLLSVLATLMIIVFIGCLIAIPVDSQFTGTTISPINPAVGYGGLFNPYVFWPGAGIKSAASTSFLLPFQQFQQPFGLFGLGLGNPLLGLSLSNTAGFNPLLGFGTSYGTSSLLGLNPLLGTNPLLGLSTFNPLNSLSIAGLGALGAGVPALSAPVAPVRAAAQSGTWLGTWQSTYIAFPILWNTGSMFLNIAEDPLLGIVAGTAILSDSRYASIPFEVSGVIVNNTITLEGFLYTGFDCALTCILTSPTTIAGFYTVLGTSTPVIDEGIFNLTLTPAVL